LGYSSTGYAGTYTTAITQDGAIVADFITAGTLNAALINVINLVAEKVLAQDGSANSVDIQSAIIKVFRGEDLRATITNSGDGSQGFLAAFSGNTQYPGTGQPILSALQDDDARLTVVYANSIYVGYDRNGELHGTVRADNVYAGDYQSASPAYYDGNVAAGTLYVKSVAPRGNNNLDVDWRLVRMADGTTAYALCQKV